MQSRFNEELKKAAFDYWQKGLAVVPIAFIKETDGKTRKQPLIDWSGLLERKQSLQDFEALPWERAMGFAIIGGDRTNDGLYIGAVDYDVKNLGDEAREKGRAVLKYLPITQIEETPSKGQHWIYLCRKQPKTIEAHHNTCGVELLGKNHLIVMAPSLGYRRLNDNTPTVVDSLESIYYEALRRAGVNTEVETELKEEIREAPEKPYIGEDPPCIRAMLEGVEEGIRDNCAIRLACYFLNMRFNSPVTVLKKLRSWNKRNKPSLDDKIIEEKVKSAEKGKYVYGCNDSVLALFCRNKAYCPLAVKTLSPLEVVERELEKQQVVWLHPLIDYTPETQLTLGAFLEASSQSAIISAEKAFLAKIKELEKQESFADSISVRQLRGVFLQPIHSRQLLLLIRARLKGEQIQIPSKKEVFQRVLQKTGWYWWHPDKRYLIAVSCWIIGSYMFVLFSHYPILHLQGERETGKSTLLWVLWLLSWNPTDPEAAPRPADLFRTIEASKPTYLLDVTKVQTRGPEAADIIDVFELGCEKGGKVRRLHHETFEPESFDVYSPKAISTRMTLPFEAKCITIITEKAPDKEYTKRRVFLREDPDRESIIRDLIICALHYWREVLDAYKGLEQTDKLTGRRFEFWAPLLAICKVFSPENYEELLSLAEADAMRKAPTDRIADIEEAVLTVVNSQIEARQVWTLKDLTVEVQKLIPWKIDWHPVKSAIANLGIMKEEYTTNQGKNYRFDRDRVKVKAQSRGISQEKTRTDLELSLGDRISLVINKCRELARDGLVNKFEVADALADRIARDEVFRLLAELEKEGKLAAKGAEWYIVN